MARRHHDHRFGVPRRGGFSFEGGERRFGVGHASQLHQGYEPPELAVAFAPVITGGPGQVDDFRPGRQPVRRARRIPQGVQPGVQHLGQRAGVRGTAGQLQGFVGQGPAPCRRRRVIEQLAGQPGEHPGPEGVVCRAADSHLQQPDQVGVDVEESCRRWRPQCQVNHWVVVFSEVGQLLRQLAGHPGPPSRRYPQRMGRLLVKAAGRQAEVLFAQRPQPQHRPQPQGRGRRDDHRRGRGGAADGDGTQKHLGRVRPTAIDVIDHDQPGGSRHQMTGRAVEIQRPRIAAQQAGGQVIRRVCIAQQLRPH